MITVLTIRAMEQLNWMITSNFLDKEDLPDCMARNFIEGVIVHVATAKQYEARRSLVTVRELLKRALWVAPDDEGDGGKKKRGRPLLYFELMANADQLEAQPETADLGGAVLLALLLDGGLAVGGAGHGRASSRGGHTDAHILTHDRVHRLRSSCEVSGTGERDSTGAGPLPRHQSGPRW